VEINMALRFRKGTDNTVLIAGITLLVLIVLAIVRWQGRGPRTVYDWVGKTAPDMTLLDLDGNPQHLAEMRGKRIFLVFWGSSCIPCLEEIPALVRVRSAVPEDRLVILGLTGDDAEFLKKQKAVTKLALNYPVVPFSAQLDQLVRPYRDIDGLPFLMVIGPDGTFEEISVGGRSYEDLLELAHGGPPS
jgi:thiol-disulfide isomerase/thioredoxin